jgi:hypothetical protein
MPTEAEMNGKVAEIARRRLPSAEITRVSVQPYVDWYGENSLSATILVRERPPQDEQARLAEIVDEFRTWLGQHDDDRFPYFQLLSEQDEKELEEMSSDHMN